MINGVAAPIYYATPNLIEAIVPYETTGSIAQIQVINNGATSNTVTTFISLTAPGVFTQNQNGLGYGSVLHADYSLVTPSNPAQPGETLQVYLTGLGAVSPAVADGAAAPAGSLSSTTNTITASIGGQAATVSYAGLVAGDVSLYQVNVQVPSAATSGDNLLAISGPGFLLGGGDDPGRHGLRRHGRAAARHAEIYKAPDVLPPAECPVRTT